jgi:hypothetical protein
LKQQQVFHLACGTLFKINNFITNDIIYEEKHLQQEKEQKHEQTQKKKLILFIHKYKQIENSNKSENTNRSTKLTLHNNEQIVH